MAPRVQHGAAVGGKPNRLYNIWRGMRQRCTNPKATGYADYGGRGIVVNPAWESFPVFQEWAKTHGYKEHLSIERQDVNGMYTPENCYWADNTIQACNKRKRLNQASAFIGVAPNKDNWQAYINHKGVRTNLGTYRTPEHAARVRDAYVTQHNLPHKLNF